MQTIGIIGAMTEEIELLVNQIEHPTTVTHFSRDYVSGTIGDKNVVVAMCGTGKVSAAICATTMIETYKVDCLIFTGVAGSLDNAINIGDIVIATKTVQHDMEMVALGYEVGLVPELTSVFYETDGRLQEAASRAVEGLEDGAHCHVGIIATGDQFIASMADKDRIVSTFGACCCEMEGAAIGQVCEMAGIPHLVIRAISDKADGSAHVDYRTFEKQAAKDCAAIVLEMLATL